MDIARNIDEEIASHFEIYFEARNQVFFTQKMDREAQIRGYFHVLAGIHATWQGLMCQPEYREVTPRFSSIDDLLFIVCFSIAQPLVDSKIGEIPDSLICEATQVSLDLLELMFTADPNPSDDIAKYLENILHVSVMNCGPAWDIVNARCNKCAALVEDDLVGDDFQILVNWLGPMLAYAEEANSEHFEGARVLWANNIFFKDNDDFYENL